MSLERNADQPALACDGLTVRYGRRVAVDDLSLEVESGTVYALLGRNGAGKTTLLRTVMGLLRADHGSACVFGADLRLERLEPRLRDQTWEVLAQRLVAELLDVILQLARRHRPDLFILDIMMPELDGYAVTRQLRQNEATKSIPILIFTAKTGLDDKMLGLELGADVYITKPISTRELLSHVNSLLSPVDRIQHPELPKEEGGLQAILAAKGGMGVSTIALNAGIILHRNTDQDVIVSDFRPGQGSMALDLGYPQSTGFDRLLALPLEDMKTRLVAAELIDHPSGIRLLLSSPEPNQAKLASNINNFERIAKSLAQLAPYVVLDLGPGMSMLNQKVLPLCSFVVIMIEPAQQSISQAKALLAEFTSLGITRDQIRLVVFNRVSSSHQLPFGQIEEQLDLKIISAFTPNRDLSYQASRDKTPIITLMPEGLTAQQINQLATNVI